MINKFNYYLKNINTIQLGNSLFLLGVLFLPSALPISGLFLLPALLISLINKNHHILNDKSNYYLFLAIGLILRNKPIEGSCGGVMTSEDGTCSICGKTEMNSCTRTDS